MQRLQRDCKQNSIWSIYTQQLLKFDHAEVINYAMEGRRPLFHLSMEHVKMWKVVLIRIVHLF